MNDWTGEGTPGALILVGGAEDKREDRAVLRRLAAAAGTAELVVVPAASSRPVETAKTYERLFVDLGVSRVRTVFVERPGEADSPRHLDWVNRAGMVFFPGGDQEKLVRRLTGSTFLELVRRRFAGGMAVAGTSAGAMACAERILFDGDRHGLSKGAVQSGPGFGLLNGVALDSHFLERYRLLRLTQFLSAGEADRGLGLPEDGGVAIGPDQVVEVIGNGVVTALSRTPAFETDYPDRQERETLSCTGLSLGFLAPGARFDLVSWCRIP